MQFSDFRLWRLELILIQLDTVYENCFRDTFMEDTQPAAFTKNEIEYGGKS